MRLSDHWRVFRYNFWLYPGRPVLLLLLVGFLGYCIGSR